jgi:hypothetical protein
MASLKKYEDVKKIYKASLKEYEKILDAYDKIVVGETSKKDLNKLVVDPSGGKLTILNYRDVVNKYLKDLTIEKEDLAEGVQRCLALKTKCWGYEISIFDEHEKEIGNFWLNWLKFRKTEAKIAWHVNIVILLTDDRVVHKEITLRSPKVELDDNIRPLGPLQDLDIFHLIINSAEKSIR